ncbi:MAG: hypothetical protein NTZ83_00465 [Candidatus Pacearchaeota archaeon]|nr:hypothetical protein [Candidatus Pacearchaeota archaeon]
MKIYKKWWFWLIILVVLIFLFPKSCGGSGSTNLYVGTTDCSCFGIKGDSLMNRWTMDASTTSCYGICLKSTCETTIIYANGTRVVK